MKPLLYIRADGGGGLGMGHLVRCRSLAMILKEDFYIFFVCMEVPESFAEDLKKYGFGLRKIINESYFINQLKVNDTVVIDSYQLDTAYQKKITEIGCKLVCIDDLHDKYFFADLIINQAPGTKKEDYKAQFYTQFAFGFEYVLLRQSFLENANKIREHGICKTVFICFGGSDSKKKTELTLNIVLRFTQFKKIIIITGGGYNLNQHFSNLIKSDIRIEHYHSIDEQMIVDLLSISDLAIVPSSGLLFEVLAIGCKVISGYTEENQKWVYEHNLKRNLFIDANKFEANNIYNAVYKAISPDFKTSPKSVIDGKSGARIQKQFRLLMLANEVNLRLADNDDKNITYEWATNPAVRKFSFHQNLISADEHENWFQTKINDSACIFYIVEFSNKRIGSIRFDSKDNVYAISYLLSPEYHGQGLGFISLTKAIKKMCAEKGPKLTFRGYVEENNTASIRIFEKLNFSKIDQNPRLMFQLKIL